MKILLTGAASDLGRALTTELEAESHQLRLIDSEAVTAGLNSEAFAADLTDHGLLS